MASSGSCDTRKRFPNLLQCCAAVWSSTPSASITTSRQERYDGETDGFSCSDHFNATAVIARA
jgi:hypothetical protein